MKVLLTIFLFTSCALVTVDPVKQEYKFPDQKITEKGLKDPSFLWLDGDEISIGAEKALEKFQKKL